MPKYFPAFTCKVIELSAFHPPPFSTAKDQRLNALCPVRALRAYMDRTSLIRRNDQLFISWAHLHTENLISKQRLSHWLVETITLAYELKECSIQRASEHTLLGTWPPRGLCFREFHCRTYVLLQSAPLPIQLSDTTGSMLLGSSLCPRSGSSSFKPSITCVHSVTKHVIIGCVKHHLSR